MGQSFGYGLTRNEGMAGCGLAVPNSDHPNLINPALLSFNRKVDLDIDLRYVYRDLKGPGNSSLSDGGGGPAQVSFIVPISKRYACIKSKGLSKPYNPERIRSLFCKISSF